MSKRGCSRRELLDRWRGIQEEEEGERGFEEGNGFPSRHRRLLQEKEQWFTDAFNFLINLPREIHIWCGSWDLMVPLLETFHNYVKDNLNDSPLKLIWKRVSQEQRQCTQCICQHHQAQETYNVEYESDTVGPLLKILRCLDEERVTIHLKEINARIVGRDYDPECHSAEVVSIMFEVLTFPILLDDQLLVNEFQVFLEAVDDSHEVTLSGHQQYPGVYALLFLKSAKARAIGLRLSGCMGKLRTATDLNPLQPLLKKYFSILETEVLPSNMETSRPRVQLERITVWLGIKALLGFLEAPAFEEGILERYPIFLSIVLNHVSDDTPEFSYAVTCLRLLLEMLGCKLWLRTTLSPSVMRNTLLGQCFHTRNEKSHKEIFDLFLPFLQSLEALQDGEHEKQRRHFIYFLLHQVTQSSNFSFLMRKNARKIALLIIHRGYKMNPPCPPFECAHMWGPSLVCSLKDSSLHSSLRQPAFDLIQTIIVSDAAALISLHIKYHGNLSINMASHTDFTDDEDELFFYDKEEKDSSCWCEFSVQSELTSRECKEWTCIPMLWLDVLVEVDPSTLPISFSKAVVWAMSHFSLVEPVSIVPMELPLSDWLSSHAGEILCSFRWEVPKGSDDGGDGRDSKNSVKASSMCIPLIRTFKRCAANFVIQMEKRELQKQWTWEPRMAESLILSLIDPNDSVRQADRIILEHVSKTRGLTPGLQFLCSSASSLCAMYLGLKYALKQVQLDSSLVNFHNLHHLFFVVRKLLKEVVPSPQKSNVIFKEDTNCSKFSGEGGFLRQPCFDHSPVTASCSSNVVDRKSWEKFSCMLSAIMWPAVLKCLVKGKEFFDNKSCQMTCVRLLETVPVLFERISLSASNLPRNLEILLSGIFDLKWLPDLVDWGRSSLMVITRHWKQAMLSLLDLIKGSSDVSMTCTIDAIEARTSFDAVAVAELKDRVSQLSVSLSKEAGQPVQGKSLKAKSLLFEPSSFGRKSSPGGISSSEDKDSHIQDTPVVFKSRGEDKVIVLSDDEMEKVSSPDVVILSSGNSSRHRLVQLSAGNNGISSVDDNVESVSARVSSSILQPFSRSEVIGYSGLTYQKQDNDVLGKAQPPSEASSSTVAPINSKCDSVTHRKDDPHDSRSLRKADAPPNDSSDRSVYHGNLDQASSIGRANIEPQKKDDFIKELIHDAEDDDDPWEFAIKSAKHHQSQQTKPCLTVPKRKLIQLAMPMNNKSGHPSRMDIGVRRLKPPRLDDWYKPILEIDYFSIVGLSSENNDENATATNLKEVPLCFHSPDHYIEIFRPLVLEEFKAQLHNSYLESSSSDEMYCGSVCILSVERIDDFHLVRGRPEDCESAARTCSENDLVLLTKEPLQNSAQHLHVVGKVERREKSDKSRSIILVIRFYLNNGSSRLNRVKRLLIERSKWYVSRVMSITPQLREFQALSSLSDITMLPTILEPTDCSASFTESKKVELDRLSQHMQIMLRSSFNNSQLQAIDAAIGTQGSKRTFKLSLIQGPPGTGKTRTIVAILSAMLALGPLRKGDASKILGNCSRQDSACSNSRAQISQSAAIARAWQDAAFAKQMIKDEETHSSGSVECPARGRVLICAQSNAAVDELVSRIKDGLYGNDGKMYRPYLVRVGNAKTVHPNSLPFFIDTLVEQRLKEDKTETDAKHEMSVDSPVSLRTKLEKLVDSIRFYESKRAKLRDYDMDTKTTSENELSEVNDENELSDAAIGAKLNMLYGQKRTVCADLAAAQAREKKIYEESKFLKQKIRKSILREAEIVMTTLSGCGGDIYGVCFNSSSHGRFGNFSESSLFDAVVIDEAAQALEPATLIPLQLLRSNGTKCIMVGDPKQLPATVLSNVASKFLYECSMFERLQRAGHPVIMLTEQYRMHPEICKFPSLHFYENKLLNGIQMSSKSAPFHECVYLGPYVFFDIVDGRERHGKNSRSLSLYNESEADAAIEIMKFFKKRYFSEFAAGRVGIITPYKSQLSLLRSRSTSELGPNTTADMEFNTVDGFQGREVDILILSTVRASDPNARAPRSNSSSIGFVADVRRMNVALTRAKLSLWIVGNARTLQTNLHWAALIKNAQERDLFVSLSSPYIFEKPSSLSNKKMNSDANLRHQKPGEKVKNVRHDADTNVVAKEDNKGKTKPIYGEQERCKFRHMSDCVSNNVDGKQMVSSATDLSSCGVVRQDHRSSKLVESTMRRHPARKPEGKDNDSQGKKDESSGMRHNLKKKPMHNQVEGKVIQAKGKLEKDSDIKTLIKEAKEAVEPLEHSSSSNFTKRSEVSQSFTEEKDSDGKGEVGNPDDSSKDLIATRKRQRDAVDALLSSALISSKRPEISSKSAPNKRPISSNAAEDAIKPSRASKVRPPSAKGKDEDS